MQVKAQNISTFVGFVCDTVVDRWTPWMVSWWIRWTRQSASAS